LSRYNIENKQALILLDGPQVFSYNDNLLYLSHGDELDIHNHAYQRYKKIIRSRFAKLLAEKFVSEKVLKKIADYLAKKSKEHQKNFDWDRSFVQYRNYVQSLWEKGIHGVIVGHSHVCDAWEEGIHFYYNVGFAPQERQFLYLGPEGLQFVPLE
jgi:UDP-2,3-diacylglucosamine pyrophosphatase LpxH